VRYLDLGARGRDVTTPGAPFVIAKSGRARALAAEVAASDIRALLDGGRVRLAAIGERDPVERPVRAGDIAVLVRTHAEGAIMERVLQRLGLPVVRSGVGSVFHAEEALHLERWLAAVSEPTNARAARALAITPFGRWSAADLAEAYAGTSAAATGAWARWTETIHARAHACGRRSLAQVLGRELSDADFLATVSQAGTWNIGTVTTVSSLAGIVAVRPSDTNWASSAGFHFNSSGELLIRDALSTPVAVSNFSTTAALRLIQFSES
jgi:hypothetical protein